MVGWDWGATEHWANQLLSLGSRDAPWKPEQNRAAPPGSRGGSKPFRPGHSREPAAHPFHSREDWGTEAVALVLHSLQIP